MTQITNGTIKVGQTIKTGDFESKRADVELSFNVAEGEDHDAAIAFVGKTAHSHLYAILGVTPPLATAARDEKPAAVKKAPKMPTVAKTEDANVVDEPAPATVRGNAKLKEAAPDPSVIEDNIDDLMGGAPAAKEITDKEMMDATQKCQQEVKNAPAIRKLLGEMGVKVPPGRVIDVEQAKRATYIEKLKEIKPLA